MRNLEKILDKISAETDRQVGNIAENTQRMLRESEQQTAEKLHRMAGEAQSQLQKETEAICVRGEAAAAMQNRTMLLEEKVRCLEEVYRRAEKAIYALPVPVYTRLLAHLTAEAVAEQVQTAESMVREYGEDFWAEEAQNGYTVLLNPADRKKLGTAVLAAAEEILRGRSMEGIMLRLGETETDIGGGVVIRYGDMETNCSVPVLLSSLRTRLEPQLMELLFG